MCKLEVVSVSTMTDGSLASLAMTEASIELGALTPTKTNFLLELFQIFKYDLLIFKLVVFLALLVVVVNTSCIELVV